MLWLDQNRPVWRIIILAIVLIAFIGPWGYDRIHVPAQYDCTFPNFRLEGDFCGVPLSGISVFVPGLGLVLDAAVRMVRGAPPDPILARNLWSLFIILIPLPVFIIPLLVVAGERLSRKSIYVVVWGLASAGGLGFLLLISLMLGLPPIRLWGFWLYIVLAIIALIVETVMQVRNRKPGFAAG